MVLASRGLRDMGRGPERIGDASELSTVRAQARGVLLRSLAAAALVMFALALLP